MTGQAHFHPSHIRQIGESDQGLIESKWGRCVVRRAALLFSRVLYQLRHINTA